MSIPKRVVRKVGADLWNAGGRAGLVVVAMATGLFGVTSIAVTNAVLTRELPHSFDAIAPASAVIRTEPLPDSILARVATIPGVGAVDGGRVLAGRAEIGEERKPVVLFTVADYGRMTVNVLRPAAGAWPPPRGTVLLERAAVRVAGLQTGAPLSMATGSGPATSLAVVGTVHDFSLAPAWQEGVIYGYVARETMARLAGDNGLTSVRIIVAERRTDVPYIREVAQRVAVAIERSGVRVRDVQIPPPGEHPHQSQMNALLGIQQVFGLVALLLSGALIVVLTTAMLVQHRRQIGTMKAVGASRGALVKMYLLWVHVLAGCAALIALPAGVIAGRAYARFIAEMLNFDVVNDAVPALLVVSLIALGGLLPVAVAMRPIFRAAAMTTREALGEAMPNALVRTRGRRSSLLDTRAGRLTLLGAGNAVRVRGRFALVVATLALGGALFLAAVNMGRSFQGTVAVNVARLGYDIALDIAAETPPGSIETAVLSVPGVSRVETAVRARAALANVADNEANAFVISSAAAPSLPPNLTRLEGRWLAAADGRVVVANHIWLREHPRYAVGDSIDLLIGTVSSRWLLAGIVREVMTPARLYAPNEVLERATRGRERTTQVHIVTTDHNAAAEKRVIAAIDRRLADDRIAIAGMSGLRDTQQHRSDHVLVIVSSLLAAAAISLLVGGLGLATMLSVSVFERSQEIGVMRAVGATRWQLILLVVAEGGCVALAGWLGSIAVSLPATYLLNNAFGRMMLGTPLDLYLSAGAIPALGAVAATVALFASGLPAWRASRLEPRALLVAA
ncbi:MAG: ABC transporter permease [Gemmatimonadota bacterium]